MSIAESEKHGHYKKDVSHLKVLDVYRLQELYPMHPCADHVVKKMLVAGGRGHKSLDKDIQDCIDTLVRWQAMRAEDAEATIEASISIQCADQDAEKIRKDMIRRYNWTFAPEWAGAIIADEKSETYYVEGWAVNSLKRQMVGSESLCDYGANMIASGSCWTLVELRP